MGLEISLLTESYVISRLRSGWAEVVVLCLGSVFLNYVLPNRSRAQCVDVALIDSVFIHIFLANKIYGISCRRFPIWALQPTHSTIFHLCTVQLFGIAAEHSTAVAAQQMKQFELLLPLSAYRPVPNEKTLQKPIQFPIKLLSNNSPVERVKKIGKHFVLN